MPSKTLTTTTGLVTQPGDWARDETSLVVAENVDLTAPGTIAKRRGNESRLLNASNAESVYGVMSTPLMDEAAGVGSVLLAMGLPGTFTANKFRFGNRLTGTTTVISAALSASLERGLRPRVATAPGNTFDVVSVYSRVASSACGLLTPVYGTNEVEWLGVPRGMGLDRLGTTLSSGTGAWLPNNHAARYAVVFVRGSPSNPGSQVGAPGMTTVIENQSGGTRFVAGRALLPRRFNTATTALKDGEFFVQVFRSANQDASLGEPPSELKLVYQAPINATDIANGYISFVDITPDNLRGPLSLYTNSLTGEDGAGGRGFINSNEPPPLAAEVATWADCLWLANLRDWTTQEVQLQAVGGTGLIAGDQIRLGGGGGPVFTAVAGAPGADQFQIITSGSASFNNRETALNFVDCVNRSASNAVAWAYYTPGQAGLPGTIVLRSRTVYQDFAFNYLGTSTSAFRVGASVTQETPAGLAFSKPLEAYAHPYVNRFELGGGAYDILRIVPYRDSLFVFKTDGLFRVTGTDWRNFSAQEFDLTFRLAARNAVAVTDDAVFAWGRQGIAKITDGGVEYIDLPIRNQVQEVLSVCDVINIAAPNAGTNFQNAAFAVADQTEGVVKFWFPLVAVAGGAVEVSCIRAFVWHARTQVWSRYVVNAGKFGQEIGYVGGAANTFDGRATYGVWQLAKTGPWADYAFIHTERKSYTSADYTDPSMANPAAPSMAGVSIPATATWNPIAAPSLGGCQWLRVQIANAIPKFGTIAPPSTLTVTCGGDFAASSSVPAIANPNAGGIPTAYVAPVPLGAARSHGLSVSVANDTAGEAFAIAGVTVDYRPYSRKGLR